MKKLIPLLLVLLPAAALAQTGGGKEPSPKAGRYNTPESASPGSTVVFPDFKLRFLGAHGLPDSDLPLHLYDYELESRSGKKATVTYATTGDIGPKPFCFEGRAYVLELFQSDKFGRLGPYGFVLWQQPKGTPCDEKQGTASSKEKDPS
ncbi:MAG: hypothetical protein DMF53_04585 [Acidobacteria bacterium]|nr:MAG: hypothetical protein DMF53_04585 [Acidobacteriota bacterium]